MRKSLRITIAILLAVLLGSALPAITFADGFPSTPCDAAHDGATWTDPETGMIWECTLDTQNGFWVWLPIGIGTFSTHGLTFESSTLGCTFNTAAISSTYYGGTVSGFDSLTGSLFKGSDGDAQLCDTHQGQPADELRSRGVISRWNGSSWVICRDTGYVSNSSSTWDMVTGYNMGSLADCGSGTYRGTGYGQKYEGGAWRGTYKISPSVYMY